MTLDIEFFHGSILIEPQLRIFSWVNVIFFRLSIKFTIEKKTKSQVKPCLTHEKILSWGSTTVDPWKNSKSRVKEDLEKNQGSIWGQPQVDPTRRTVLKSNTTPPKISGSEKKKIIQRFSVLSFLSRGSNVLQYFCRLPCPLGNCHFTWTIEW